MRHESYDYLGWRYRIVCHSFGCTVHGGEIDPVSNSAPADLLGQYKDRHYALQSIFG